jgi:hypothetical protein
MIAFDTKGLKNIQRKLARLETKEVAKIARTDTRKVQKDVMLPAVRENATGMVGGKMGAMLTKNLTVRAMTKMQRGSYGHKVIIKATDAFVHIAADGTRSYIPNAIEYGHAAPYDEGGSKVTRALPFQRDAYEKKRRPASEKLAREMVKDIERAVRSK